jgi:GrpB-like predicted nucleotidyltransferase (UPF0157 family)
MIIARAEIAAPSWTGMDRVPPLEPDYLVEREPARRVLLVDPDPRWPALYDAEEVRIRDAVAPELVELHHVGSTSVPGLAAKPVIDILLLVRDSSEEETYAPGLQRSGYTFVLREPHWQEHRLFKRGLPHFRSADVRVGGVSKVNLHVFTAGAEEGRRMLAFRDRLRADIGDRRIYEATKRRLAAQEWGFVQEYADAKGAVVSEIMTRTGR